MIRNMRSAATCVNESSVGVLGYVDALGRLIAVAVTPYVVDGRIIISSTPAYIDKALALSNDPRVALLVEGVSISGTAKVTFDPTGRWFDQHLKTHELRKYPPAKTLLGLPFSRRLFSWYRQRLIIDIEPFATHPSGPAHGASILGLGADATLRLVALPASIDLDADVIASELPLGSIIDGPATVLLHQEFNNMNDLRQRRAHGTLQGSQFRVARRVGSLGGTATTTLDQLRLLRQLGRRARRNLPRLHNFPFPNDTRSGGPLPGLVDDGR